MLQSRILLAGLLPLAVAPATSASDAVRGETSEFESPGGVVERCVRIDRMPGAVYSAKDARTESAYCAIDLYAETVALCPKTWSTSPGMVIYDVGTGDYENDHAGFEQDACAAGHRAEEHAGAELAKFKSTMNDRNTSGTFSTASLLYYHFSRYFEADVGVPPAVWRSMDRSEHLERVARPGVALSGHSHSSPMNHAGWVLLAAADADPSAYKPTGELYSEDRTAIYGVLLSSPGTRYNSAVNGTRKSGWGKGQNLDFQETAPFLALRSTAPLKDAIGEGVNQAAADPQLRRDTGAAIDDRQVAFWMTELANIVLLDYLFSQQDRIGNIDYSTYWYWVEDGEVRRKSASSHDRKETPPVAGAVRIKRTHLNDNDAGGRVEYANFAKSTQMLEKLRHFPATTYRKLAALHADFASRGPLYDYLRDSFGLDARQVAQVVNNTAQAFAILGDSCSRGMLRFDLDPEAFFLGADLDAAGVDCAIR